MAARRDQGPSMHLASTKYETAQALGIILDRLHAMARRSGASPDNPADLEAILLGLPDQNRSQILLVLESLESRARARADEGLAQAARLVRDTADQVWAEQGGVDRGICRDNLAPGSPERPTLRLTSEVNRN